MEDLAKIFLCRSCQNELFWKRKVDFCPVCQEDKLESLNLCLQCLEVCGKLAIIVPIDLIQVKKCIACKIPIRAEDA